MSALKDKPNNSIAVASKRVKDGEADAVVLCGNTAASVAAAQLHLRRIKGVKRAGILTPLPTVGKKTWVIDCGANAVGKPEHLVQFAEMGNASLQRYCDMARPRVGILNIGSEDGKGDELTGETHELLRQTKLNVIGNVEGDDIYTGDVDLVVCDGFTGNVVLKTSEGVAKAIGQSLREEIQLNLKRKIGYGLMKGAFDGLRQRTHWSIVGGCLLLGVDGVTVIGHGKSDRVAVYHALGQAVRCVETGVIAHVTSQVAPDRVAQDTADAASA